MFFYYSLESYIITDTPEGKCVHLHADSVLLTCYPPGPYALIYSNFNSFIFISKFNGTSGSTNSYIADVYTLPYFSVTGTLMTLCTPDSNNISLYTVSPYTFNLLTREPSDDLSSTL